MQIADEYDKRKVVLTRLKSRDSSGTYAARDNRCIDNFPNYASRMLLCITSAQLKFSRTLKYWRKIRYYKFTDLSPALTRCLKSPYLGPKSSSVNVLTGQTRDSHEVHSIICIFVVWLSVWNW